MQKMESSLLELSNRQATYGSEISRKNGVEAESSETWKIMCAKSFFAQLLLGCSSAILGIS